MVPGQQPTVWASGLTAITGCGFDRDGEFYAAEFSTLGFESFKPETGALVRVPPHSTSPVTVVPKLSLRGGFAAWGDSVYVSNFIVAPAHNQGGPTGQVLRVVVEEGEQGGGGNGQGGGNNSEGGHGESGHSQGGNNDNGHGARSHRESSTRGHRD